MDCHGAKVKERESYDHYSHEEDHYDKLILKQQVKCGLGNIHIKPLNNGPVAISKKKKIR